VRRCCAKWVCRNTLASSNTRAISELTTHDHDTVPVPPKPDDYGKGITPEIVAGGKLYNIVVANEHMGKDLLKRGGIKKRVFIALNEICPFKLSAEVLPTYPLSFRSLTTGANPSETAHRKTRRAGKGVARNQTCRLRATQMKWPRQSHSSLVIR
jgi:hypothetical protein